MGEPAPGGVGDVSFHVWTELRQTCQAVEDRDTALEPDTRIKVFIRYSRKYAPPLREGSRAWPRRMWIRAIH